MDFIKENIGLLKEMDSSILIDFVAKIGSEDGKISIRGCECSVIKQIIMRIFCSEMK